MNAYMSEPLQPFRVDAKVLRPGSLAQTTSNKKPYGDTVTRAIEIVLMLALTAASVPFIATGIVWGFIYLIALVGALYLLVTAGVLAGLYGVWSRLLRSDLARRQAPARQRSFICRNRNHHRCGDRGMGFGHHVVAARSECR